MCARTNTHMMHAHTQVHTCVLTQIHVHAHTQAITEVSATLVLDPGGRKGGQRSTGCCGDGGGTLSLGAPRHPVDKCMKGGGSKSEGPMERAEHRPRCMWRQVAPGWEGEAVGAGGQGAPGDVWRAAPPHSSPDPLRPSPQHHASLVMSQDPYKVTTFEKHYAVAIQWLWRDAGVRACYERRREFHLLDSAV